ncbi:Endonuclease/exonuclease/phosphatase [Trinorchestia longiramus]|nr:Endonuclease/exonuclease/phosphatase [Trinorchestia longiramus]
MESNQNTEKASQAKTRYGTAKNARQRTACKSLTGGAEIWRSVSSVIPTLNQQQPLKINHVNFKNSAINLKSAVNSNSTVKSNSEATILGYVLHNDNKPSHSNKGGGSLNFMKEKLQPQIETKRATEKSEILHLNIQPHPGKSIKIGLVYRNTSCTTIEDDKFYDCHDNILSTPHTTLIMGDFNLSHINWTTRQSHPAENYLI